MSPIWELIITPNLIFSLSWSKSQIQQFKKDVLNSATEDAMMKVHNKTQK